MKTLIFSVPLKRVKTILVGIIVYVAMLMNTNVALAKEGSIPTPTDADPKQEKIVEDSNNKDMTPMDQPYYSNLPVIYIDTDDGLGITSKKEYKPAKMVIKNNGESDEVIYSDGIEIKGRGNSSWSFSKKPYKIKLNSKTDLFGMGKNKHWVLLANFLDESLVRNTTATQIAKELDVVAMDTVWVDVVLNGDYIGNYQLCEHIRIDENRINIFDWESEAEDVASAIYKKEKASLTKDDKAKLEDLLKNDFSWISTGVVEYESHTYIVSDYYEVDDDLSGGYLFELSNEYDELSKFLTPNGLKVMVNSPEYLYTNEDMMSYVKDYWSDFEQAYCSEDGYNAKGKHYTEYSDLDSMVSYWLVMEIMGNNDAYYKSRYAYLDKSGKLLWGPAWDFDWGCGSSVVGSNATGWKVSKSNNVQAFYKEFLDDPVFLVKAVEKYWQVRPYLEEIVKDGGILDQEYTYLLESGKKDEARWPRKPELANGRGFTADYEIFHKYLKERLVWLDKQFLDASTLLKSTYYEESSYPFVKSDGVMTFEMNQAAASSEVKSDFAVELYGDVNAKLKISNNDTSAVKIYVNGMYVKDFDVDKNVADIRVSNAYMTEAVNKANVIVAIGKNTAGKTTYKNFWTVEKIDNSRDCNEFGGHDYSGQLYKYEIDFEEKHYQECKFCGEKSGKEACKGGNVKKEDIIEPTCTTDGSHNDVVYCIVCNQVLSSTPVIDRATGNHDFTKCVSNGNGTHKILCIKCDVVQNGHDKDSCFGGVATCKAKAKCSRCNAEYGSLAAHKPGTAVKENVIAATTDIPSSYDEVVYCTVCNNEISRKKITGEKLKPKEAPNVSVSYRTHVQTYGWQNYVKDGVTSGTYGQAKRLEGINIKVEGNNNLGVIYTTHCQTYGWLPWSANGDMSGTEGEAKRLEAIEIKLTGSDKDQYDIYYRVHAQTYGWLGWAKNGDPAGTAGYAKRLESIQVVVVKKGANVPNLPTEGIVYSGGKAFYAKEGKSPIVNYPATSNRNPVIPGENLSTVTYRAHVQSIGWQGCKFNGQMSGTSGMAKRLEGIEIKLNNKQYSGGITYRTHVQTYGWQSWKSDGDMAGTSGEAKRLEAIEIKLTGEMAKQYDVYYRVHAQSYGWLAWAKNGESAGTEGLAKRLEGIQIVLVKKGDSAPGNTYMDISSANSKAFFENK